MNTRDHALWLIEQAGHTRHTVICPREFIDFMDGDRNAATVLNQILYWTDRTANSEGWFYKSYDEWYEELGLTKYQVRRVIWGDERVQQPKKTLRDIGLEVSIKRAPSGSPTVHYRLDQSIFFATLVEYLENRYSFQADTTLENETHNVTDAKPTMLTMENQHCAQSSSNKDHIEIKLIDRISDLKESENHNLSELPLNWQTAISQQIQRLGPDNTRMVMERCLPRSRSWAYIHKALLNEPTPIPSLKTAATCRNSDTYIGEYRNPMEQEETAALYVSPNIEALWESDWPGFSHKSVKDMWDTAFNQLELQLDRTSFSMYLRKATLVDYLKEQQVFVIAVHSSSIKEALEYRLYRNILRVLQDLCGQEVDIKVVLSEDWQASLIKQPR